MQLISSHATVDINRFTVSLLFLLPPPSVDGQGISCGFVSNRSLVLIKSWWEIIDKQVVMGIN